MRHLYRIQDGGEYYDYSADSPQAALFDHLGMNYVDAGVEPSQPIDWKWSQLPDDKILRVGGYGKNEDETVEKTAREWANDEEGLIGSTCV